MQQDASSVLTLENKIQVCTCRDFASQTEAEIMTRCQVERLTEIMQSRFDEVIGQCQEQMAHLQNLVAGSVRSSTSSPSARNEAGPSMANCEESAETKWKHVMDEHVAAKVEAKQRRREERIALHSSKSSGRTSKLQLQVLVLIVYPDAWLEDARQGATPGQRAPQPLLKKRVSGLGFLEALQRDLVQKGFRDLWFRLPKPECFW